MSPKQRKQRRLSILVAKIREHLPELKILGKRSVSKEMLARRFRVKEHEAHEALVQLNLKGRLVSQARHPGRHDNEWTRDYYSIL